MHTVSIQAVGRRRGARRRSGRGDSVLGILIKLGLTVLLLAVVFFIGRVGLADFLRLESTSYIDKVNEGQVRLSMERLEKSRQRLLLAGRIDADNPVIPEYLAQIAYIRASYSDANKELQRGYLNEALTQYQLALRLRPNSGYLWAGEMAVIHLLMSSDEVAGAEGAPMIPATSAPQWKQMMVAMKHAIQLAPWEPGVLTQVVAVGNKYYPVLGSGEKQLFDSAKRNAGSLGLVVE